MKKLLTILFVFLSFVGVSQTLYPTPYAQQGSPSTMVQVRGGWRADSTAVLPTYSDTIKANRSKTSLYPGSMIRVANDYYYRSADTTRWILIATTNSNCGGTRLIDGSITWSGTNYIFNATQLDYGIICGLYHSDTATLTVSPSDPTYPRIDVFYADTSGNVGIITGTPSPTPVKPSVNPLSQIEVSFVYVPAGSVTPPQTATIIYNENIEWAGASNVPSINFAYTINPYDGLVSTYFSSMASGTFISYQNGSVLNINNYQYLKFYFRRNSALGSDPASTLVLDFYNGNTLITNSLFINDGAYGYDASVIGSYQLIVVPISSFTFADSLFDKLYITNTTGSLSSCQLDKIYLLGSVPPPPVISNSWVRPGNANTNPVTDRVGTTDSTQLNIGANSRFDLIVPADGINFTPDSSTHILVRDPITNKLYWIYQPSIYALGCLKIYDSTSSGITRKYIRDTCVAGSGGGGGGGITALTGDVTASGTGSVPATLATVNSNVGSFTNANITVNGKGLITAASNGIDGGATRYIMSSTAPTDTSAGWIDLRYNFYNAYPVHYRVNGAWSDTDTTGGQFWDNVGKVFSRGKPYVIIATGQSNLGGSYIGEGDPNRAGYNGYYGDTIPALGVSAWNNNRNIWTVAKIRDTPFQYSTGANFLLLEAKRINKETGRSVRIVTYPQGGTGLQCWSGAIGVATGDSACYLEFKSRVQGAGIQHPDLFIWAQSEAGLAGAGAMDYYNKWKEMVDTMIHKDHLMDTSTYKVLLASGDLDNGAASFQVGNGSAGGDGALRALAASNDRYIRYVDALTLDGSILSDGIHFTPRGHEELARRLDAAIKAGVKVPGRDMMGYGSLAPYKLSLGKQQLSASGLVYTDQFGKLFTSFEGSNSITSYRGATKNASGDSLQGLNFDPVGLNAVILQHYNGNIKLQLDPTRILLNGNTDLPSGSQLRVGGGGYTGYNPGTGAEMTISTNSSSPAKEFLLTSAGVALFKNGGLADASAALDIKSTSKGLLIPRMTSIQRTAIPTPAKGLQVFDLDSASTFQYNGSTWQNLYNTGSGSTGTVTSVAALTLGTTGTDLSSSVANGTTTPVITLNVPTASASNRGALSSTDWSTFNNKQSAITFGTGVQTALGVNIGSAGAPVLFNGAGGTPSSLTLTNATGLPIAGTTGYGTGVATALAVATNATGGMLTGASSFSANVLTVLSDFRPTKTITAAGTTGAQTINKTTGTVNFAAGASTLVVTNSFASANSVVIVTVYGTDATATSARVTKASGSFTITLNAAATAETAVGFMVTN